MLIAVKYALTSLVIVVVSEIAKRHSKLGALISSLPLVTVLVMVWLFVEKQGTRKIAEHAFYTFWYVLPTMPMFLLMPWLLAKGWDFWPTLAVGAAVTFAAFVLTALVARGFGVDLLP